MFGNIIKKGDKRHKVTFRDEVEPKSSHFFTQPEETPQKRAHLPIIKRFQIDKVQKKFRYKPREPQEHVKESLIRPLPKPGKQGKEDDIVSDESIDVSDVVNVQSDTADYRSRNTINQFQTYNMIVSPSSLFATRQRNQEQGFAVFNEQAGSSSQLFDTHSAELDDDTESPIYGSPTIVITPLKEEHELTIPQSYGTASKFIVEESRLQLPSDFLSFEDPPKTERLHK